MSQWFIIGAGGLAKEVFRYCREDSAFSLLNFGGFVDVKPSATSVRTAGQEYIVLDQHEFLANEAYRGARVVFAVGNPRVLIQLRESFGAEYEYPNVIANGSFIDAHSLSLGKGNVIGPGTFVGNDAKIGDFNLIGPGCKIGHDSTLGCCNVLNMGASVAGCVSVGEGVLLGASATIIENLEIGDAAEVMAASFVFRSVKPGVKVGGNPARKTL